MNLINNDLKLFVYSRNALLYKLLLQIYPNPIHLQHSPSTNCFRTNQAWLILVDICSQEELTIIIPSFTSLVYLHPSFVLLSPKLYASGLMNLPITKLYKPIYHTSLLHKLIRPYQPIIKLHTQLFLNPLHKKLIKITADDYLLISLTDKECALLSYLHQTSAKGNYACEEDILHNVFQYQSLIDTNTVKTHIYKIKQKIGDDLGFIRYIRNKGYLI